MRCKFSTLLCGVGFIVFLDFVGFASAGQGDEFSKDGLVTVVEATGYPHLTLAVHPNVPIQPNQNVVWCSSFQLAWNEACFCSLVAIDLQF